MYKSTPHEDEMKAEALKLIAEHFGKETAHLYEDFYNEHDLNTVMESIQELLSDHLGEEKAQEVLSSLKYAI